MISFIVPAHNEERLLGRTLVAIHDAAAGIGQPSEVIVVDDASEDLTSAVAAQHGARIERVDTARSPEREMPAHASHPAIP